MTAMWAVRDIATAAFSAVLCAGFIVLLRPWLRCYALAMPNARSSHREPTPQGGGIAVIAATIAAACFAVHFFAIGGSTAAPLYVVFAGAGLMASVGAVD